MWILSRVNNEEKVYLLSDKPKYTVGRNKTCDIVGESTQSSVGRLHATLHPYEDRVEVVDTDSKYGTYVNEQISSNERLTPNAPVALKGGDTVRFGFIDFTWKLEKNDLVVLTSTLTDKEKENLRKDVRTMGGQFIDEWSDNCTHLVVKNLTLTGKVLQALCHAIPIVRPEYFRVTLAAIRSKSILPEVGAFQPAIVERTTGPNVSLLANIDRKRLFVGKTFVFMNTGQMEKFKGIVECAMGECSSLDANKWQRRSLVKDGVIVINNTAGSTQSQLAAQTANELNDFLRSKGSRMVPESEISLAILHCSLDKFCNPKYTLKDNFESKSRALPSTLLADNTPTNQQRTSSPTSSVSTINVPETVDLSNSLASTVTSNSEVISLMDDDDDGLLVAGAELAMSMSINKGKRKNSTDIEEPSTKKPNLEKSSASTTKSNASFVFDIPQRSTRSAAKLDVSTTKLPAESVPAEKSVSVETNKSNPEPEKIVAPSKRHSLRSEKIATPSEFNSLPSAKTATPSKRNSPLQSSIQLEPPGGNSERFLTEISAIEGSQRRAAGNSQPNCVTSTQIETPKRKRIAHRPTSSAFGSTFGGNISDSDDELFKFNNEPTAKKSRPTRDSDSDSDDNRNYPRSSGPVVPVSISLHTYTQPTQYAPDSWLSRPTPTQTCTDATIRSKPKKRGTVEKPKQNTSTGWQIGQWGISTPRIQIPTQGWCSKDAIKSASFDNEIKSDNVNEKNGLEDDSKLTDTINCGIQVITKSMNLMTTGGKVFKKQRFIVPSEIIKTTKIYEF